MVTMQKKFEFFVPWQKFVAAIFHEQFLELFISIHTLIRVCLLNQFHQTLHLWAGFMGLSTGQENSFEKGSKFESVPKTRKRAGECCTALIILFLLASRRMSPHHTWAKLRKKSCVLVRFNSGSFSPSRTWGFDCWLTSQRLYVRYAWWMPPPSAIFSPKLLYNFIKCESVRQWDGVGAELVIRKSLM